MIELNLPIRWLHADAIAVWPFLLVDTHVTEAELARLRPHEAVHGRQQRRWFTYGLGPLGLLAWYLCYLLLLPVAWNPWRRKWESEAMREGDHLSDARIAEILREPPYYLWWT
jgi:hypothetical protein